MDEIFKTMFPTDDKVALAQQSSLYLDNLLKYLQLIYYTEQIGDDRVKKAMKRKIVPIFEQLAEEMGKTIEDYTRKHGEI